MVADKPHPIDLSVMSVAEIFACDCAADSVADCCCNADRYCHWVFADYWRWWIGLVFAIDFCLFLSFGILYQRDFARYTLLDAKVDLNQEVVETTCTLSGETIVCYNGFVTAEYMYQEQLHSCRMLMVTKNLKPDASNYLVTYYPIAMPLGWYSLYPYNDNYCVTGVNRHWELIVPAILFAVGLIVFWIMRLRWLCKRNKRSLKTLDRHRFPSKIDLIAARSRR